MTWKNLLQAQRIRQHRTSVQELDDLRNLIERDLQDAAVPALSADRKFATAYNAILQMAKMVIACEGYRVVGPGHHLTTFECLENAMPGLPVSALVAYFDTCRRKRNQVDYDSANIATETEAEELIHKRRNFAILSKNGFAKITLSTLVDTITRVRKWDCAQAHARDSNSCPRTRQD
jgi:hypothetical protein